MRKWWPLVAVCTGAFMLLVDVTIVTVALPDMARGLRTSFSAVQWVMDLYALVLAALLLGVGAAADRVGRRRVCIAGLVVFAVSSLACGLAPNAAVLIAARGVQGLGAAAMFATTMALLNSTYQGRDRGIAFGVWGAVNGAAAAAGPVLGGLLTQGFGWRSIFLVNLPISVLAVLLTLRVVQESRDPRARGIDLPGLATFTTAAGAVTYALVRSGEAGWSSASTLGTLALGGVALVVFLAVEARTSRPMLDLRLFRSPSFTAIMLAGFLLSVAAFSSPVYTSVWLQSVLRLSAIEAGLVLIPMSVTSFVVSAVAGRFLQGMPARFTIGCGLVLIGAGASGEAVLSAGSAWFAVMPGIAVTGLGVGLATPSLSSAALASVPVERSGMAAGAISTFRQLGLALGIAVLGSVFRSGLADSLSGSPAAGSASALGGGQAGVVIRHAPVRARPAVEHAVRSAFAHGLDTIYLVAGVVGVAAGVIVLLLVRPFTPAHATPSAPRIAVDSHP